MNVNKLSCICLSAFIAVQSIGVYSVFAANTSKYFSDVNEINYGWAADYVDYIAENDIATGVGNGLYEPGKNIKKGDFAILVDKTFALERNDNVLGGEYYSQAIANCSKSGIIANANTYEPAQDITRIEAICMIYNALRNCGIYTGNIDINKISVFSDNNLIIGANEKNASIALYDLGIISGDNEHRLNPDATMTRAEMAVVFAKLNRYIVDNKNNSASANANNVPADNNTETAVQTEVPDNTIKENQQLRDLTFDLNEDRTKLTVKFLPDAENDYANMSEKINITLYDRFDKLIYERKNDTLSIQNNHDLVEYDIDLLDIYKYVGTDTDDTITLTHSKLHVEITSEDKVCAKGDATAGTLIIVDKTYSLNDVTRSVDVLDSYITTKSKLYIKFKFTTISNQPNNSGGVGRRYVLVCKDLMGKELGDFPIKSEYSDLPGSTAIITFESRPAPTW